MKNLFFALSIVLLLVSCDNGDMGKNNEKTREEIEAEEELAKAIEESFNENDPFAGLWEADDGVQAFFKTL